MGKQIAKLGRQDHHDEHKWVRYSNPRNGRIQVNACRNCGTMLASIRASKPCKPKLTKNPMESRGWVINSQPSKERGHRIKAGA